MRPVRLTLQAFGPYPERVVLDFRDAVEAGLFGIYGQTGSGKSTIFSAMTFALFGQAARSDQEAPSLRSDHAAPDTPTEVEFVFDVGERRYVILRRPDQMRPKKHGEGETRSVHEAFLFDATGKALDEIGETSRGKIVAEKKVRTVDAAIEKMLGYGPEQFRQIVLLPQGRFEKFLSAKTKERLEILRELFDVSRYEALMADLKVEAETAERFVREERELCVRQLSAEGFESPEALNDGIAAAQARYADLLTSEENAKEDAETAEKNLRSAEAVEEKFATADRMNERLSMIAARKLEIEALDKRVQEAERARSLLDVESLVREGAREVRAARAKLDDAEASHTRAVATAKAAAEALELEEARSGEADDLRRRKVELERFAKVLAAAADSKGAVEEALQAQQSAKDDLDKTTAQLEKLQRRRQAQADGLKAAREAEARRADIVAQRTGLNALHAAARNWETAEHDVRMSHGAVEEQKKMAAAAADQAASARQRFEDAERNLASAQALHLATRLSPGAPCPVCGGTDHPSPATGEVGNAGLDKAFRDARDAWQEADTRVRHAERKLAGLRATLEDREQRLSRLERPQHPAATFEAEIRKVDEALAALPPQIDVAAAEAELDGLDSGIGELERSRDGLRNKFDDCRQRAVEASAIREGKLAEVPEILRSAQELAVATQEVSRSLTALEETRAQAEETARKAREHAIGAAKDVESAGEALESCMNRHQAAKEVFARRLEDVGLTSEAFEALKPSIDAIEKDRAIVETYRRDYASASDAATAAQSAIKGQTRPDLAPLRETLQQKKLVLAQASEDRIGAKASIDRLTTLRATLADALRKLDEAEAASGPLRGLAALVNGQNAQRLTLETFAIGAMFEQVLQAANLRLDPMTSGRYRLERDAEGAGRGSRGLGIQVFDIHTGKSRPTSTLSGGETFIAALALALGLADVVEGASGKVRLDTIFIDEGFGSLDTENGSGTLDQVLQVLNGIVSQNRAVGLISHVPLVQEAIPNGFYVRKTLADSTVEERGLV